MKGYETERPAGRAKVLGITVLLRPFSTAEAVMGTVALTAAVVARVTIALLE